MSRFRRRAMAGLAVIAVLGLGLCGSVVAMGLKLSAPAVVTVGPVPPALLGAEAVVIPFGSTDQLQGWWVPGAPGGAAVVLMHGVGGNRLQMVERARVLQAQGFSSLLFDFQAHGESGGTRITFGQQEARDAAAAVRYVRSRLPGARVGAIGFSLGGAAAVLGAAPLPVDALVLESVYPDIDAALASRLRAGLGPVGGPVLTPILTALFQWLLPPILGVTPKELRPIDHIGSATAPILVVSGSVDPLTPIGEAAALFSRAREPKAFWAVPGAGHVDLERYAPAEYWAHIMPFLVRTLRPPA